MPGSNMLLRNTMTFILVVWQLAAWVTAGHDLATTDDRTRRAQLKRRMLERLAERGLAASERENLAEELLSNIYGRTTTEPPYVRPRRDQHRIRHHHSQPYASSLSSSFSPSLPSSRSSSPSSRSSSSISALTPNVKEAAMRLAEPAEVLPLDVLEAAAAREVRRNLEEAAAIIEEEAAVREEEAAVREEEAAVMEEEVVMRRPIRERLSDYRLREIAPRILDPKTSPRIQRSERKKERERKRNEKKNKRAKKKKVGKRQRELNNFLERERENLYENEDKDTVIDCCPSVMRVKPKLLGEAFNGSTLEISPESQLIFYERICKEGYEGRECVFPPRTMKRGVSMRCVQQTSYSQAIARPYGSDGEYNVDFIKVRSGCACQVTVAQKKKRKRKR